MEENRRATTILLKAAAALPPFPARLLSNLPKSDEVTAAAGAAE